MLALSAVLALSSILTVGPGKAYSRIEDAVAAARRLDQIVIYPSPTHYRGTAVRVMTPRLRIRGEGAKPVEVEGGVFEYSGVGKVPRAIFQFDPGSDGSTLRNLDLSGAHNRSYNGAGVRINQASDVTIEGCEIHGNDMGVMSNGAAGEPRCAENQAIIGCRIYANGNAKDPGYNHNLYLGGSSVTLTFCSIYGSLTGHNLKSRAHLTIVQYCSIHGSANRECDFVEAWDTERPGSDVLLTGNVIVKDPSSAGNRNVIHFGQEKGRRNGTLYLINNTIVTPFMSPVILLSSPQSSAVLGNNVILCAGQSKPILAQVSGGAQLAKVSGSCNWISGNYDLRGTRIDLASRYQGGLTLGPDPLLGAKATKFRSQGFIGAGDLSGMNIGPVYRYQGKGKWLPGGSIGGPTGFIGAG